MLKRLSFAALAAAGSLWGLGFVFGKIALADMPVEAMVAWRFVIATIVLLPFVFGRDAKPLYKPRTLLLLAIAGVLFVPVQFLIAFKGLALTSVTHASLMVAVLPGLIALGSLIVNRRWLRGTTVGAIALSIAGAGIIVLRPDHGASPIGDALVLVSLIAAVAWILFTERHLASLSPVSMTAIMIAIGTIVLVAIAGISQRDQLVHLYSLRAMLAVAASGVFSTAASTVLWNVGLRTVDASRAGVFVNMEPLVGALCGVLFFGDAFGWQLLTGAVLVLSAALTVTLQGAAEDHKHLPHPSRQHRLDPQQSWER